MSVPDLRGVTNLSVAGVASAVAAAAKPVERLHHPFSPSKLQYLEPSPCYVGEQSKDTTASEAGTRQHDAAEDHVDIDDPTLEDHQAEAVAMCKGFRQQVIAKYPGGTVLKEVYLPVDGKTVLDKHGNKFAGTTGGYIDLAVISADKKKADVVDWKFGLWSVEPTETNLQGIAYLLGLYYANPTLEAVTVTFCMPHREEMDSHTFTRDQFPALLLRVYAVVARAQHLQAQADPCAGCTATISSCLFCGNKGKCAVLTAFALKVGKKYAPIQVPENVTPSSFTDPKQSKISMEVAQLMEAWAKAVRGQITLKSIEEDVWLPDGYKLVSRSSNDIVNGRGVYAEARRLGVPRSVLRECVSIKLTPLNKAISDRAERGKKKDAVNAFREKLLELGHLVKENPIYFLERLKT